MIDQLRAIAEAATAGPWWQYPPNSVYAAADPPPPDDETDDWTIVTWYDHARPISYGDFEEHDAAYVAAFSPDVVLKLLAVVELAAASDCLNDHEDRATCESPLCRALAALEPS